MVVVSAVVLLLSMVLVLRCQNPTKLRLKAIYQVFVLGSRDNLDLCTNAVRALRSRIKVLARSHAHAAATKFSPFLDAISHSS